MYYIHTYIRTYACTVKPTYLSDTQWGLNKLYNVGLGGCQITYVRTQLLLADFHMVTVPHKMVVL